GQLRALAERALSGPHRAPPVAPRRARHGLLRDDGTPRLRVGGGSPAGGGTGARAAVRDGGGALPGTAPRAQRRERPAALPAPAHAGAADAAGALGDAAALGRGVNRCLLAPW